MIVRIANISDRDRSYMIINSNLDDYFSYEVIEYFMMQWPQGQLIAEDLLGNPMGVLCGSKLPNGNATVSLLAVDSPYRGRGVGTQLMEHFRTRCYMEGFGRIQLEVRTTNLNAIRFYTSNGFRTTETLRHFYNDGGDAYRMVCDLQFRNGASY